MQKEALSALMDGEIDNRETANTLINQMNKDADLRNTWSRYHLMRDALKAEANQMVQIDIAAKVAEQLKDEPIIFNGKKTESEAVETKRDNKIIALFRPISQNLLQFSVAASFAFALIVGVQQLNKSNDDMSLQYSENPTFNTLPIFGEATQVSLGVPSPSHSMNNGQALSQRQMHIQEQRQRINAMLQDYELQKRLNKNQSEPAKAEVQVGLSVPGTQNLGEGLLSTQ